MKTPRTAALNGGNLRVIVGITGASGSIYGWRLLEKLRAQDRVETHLVLSRSGERTAFLEMGKAAADFKALAHFHYPVEDIGCRLASGSVAIDAMVIAPCSIHTMSAIAHGISSNLIVRAADVTLKERRRLVLMVRESPLHLGHLRSMAALAEMGAILAPPMPAFYLKPQTVADIVEHSVDRVMAWPGTPGAGWRSWSGKESDEAAGDQTRQEGIAFQGELGAFSQQAIRQLLGLKAEPIPHQRFDEVFAALDAGKVDAAVIPLENTLAGSVHENYDLLLKYSPGNHRRNQRARDPQSDRSARRFLPRDPQSVLAPGGAQPVPGLFRQPPAHRTHAVLRHRGQRKNDHGRAACRRRGHRLRAGGPDLRRPHLEAWHRRRPPEFHPLLPAGTGRAPNRATVRGASKRPWKTSLVFSTRNIPGSSVPLHWARWPCATSIW